MAERVTYWRVGSKVHRTLYRGDELVGLVDTPEIALEVIQALNARGRSLVQVAADSIEFEAQRYDDAFATERERDVAHGLQKAVEILRGIAAREPRDAQRRSEATPQNDLRIDRSLINQDPLDPSRVDPYDTTKGGVTDG